MAAFSAALALSTGMPAHPAAWPATTRAATPDEHAFCLAHPDEGPITGDCAVVPLAGDITEDDPWGRWDCRTNGNHTCSGLIFFRIGGEFWTYEVNDPHRPACFVQPSSTREGFEVIFSWDLARFTDELGFEVNCPI